VKSLDRVGNWKVEMLKMTNKCMCQHNPSGQRVDKAICPIHDAGMGVNFMQVVDNKQREPWQEMTTGQTDNIANSQYIPLTPPSQSCVCPHCGYCPYCGRGGYYGYPYQYPFPYIYNTPYKSYGGVFQGGCETIMCNHGGAK
jgi:hypothetical protein